MSLAVQLADTGDGVPRIDGPAGDVTVEEVEAARLAWRVTRQSAGETVRRQGGSV